MITPRKTKGLVVDDEKFVRDFLTRFLNLNGITEVKEAEDGLQAFEILKQEEFDLVFAEIVMCKMGGLALFDVRAGQKGRCSGLSEKTV